MSTYLTRNTAAVAVVVVSAKRDVVANNMKLTKEKLQQIIEEELENLVNEETFPEDKYKELEDLRAKEKAYSGIVDSIGIKGYEALLKLKKEKDEVMKKIPKDEMTTDDMGDPQSKRYVEYTKIAKKAMDLFKNAEEAPSIVRNIVSSFMDRDPPEATDLKAMMDKLEALSGEFEERGSTDDQDRRYGRTSTTVTHKPTGTSKKILSNQGSLGT